MRIDELRVLALFEGLTDEQLAELVEGSAEVSIQPGAELFRRASMLTFLWLRDGTHPLAADL